MHHSYGINRHLPCVLSRLAKAILDRRVISHSHACGLWGQHPNVCMFHIWSTVHLPFLWSRLSKAILSTVVLIAIPYLKESHSDVCSIYTAMDCRVIPSPLVSAEAILRTVDLSAIPSHLGWLKPPSRPLRYQPFSISRSVKFPTCVSFI